MIAYSLQEMGGKRKSVALEWKTAKSVGKGNFPSKQECTKTSIKNQCFKIYKSVRFTENKWYFCVLKLLFIPKKFIVSLVYFCLFMNAQSFKKQSLDFLLYTPLSYRCCDFRKSSWDRFALCFLKQQNNVQAIPKSFYLFTYLSRTINLVESKR